MTHWVLDWLRAFALTVAIEVLVALLLFRRFGRCFQAKRGENDGTGDRRPVRLGAMVLLANFVTHPLVWFAFPGLTVPYFWRVFWSEMWALLAESGAYWVMMPWLGAKRAGLVALLANGASYALGLLLLS